MLLMPDDKKRVASIIVGEMKPDYVGKEKGGYEKEFEMESKDDDDEESLPMVVCCEKVIECVKRGDAKGMASYMKDLVDMCKGSTEVY